MWVHLAKLGGIFWRHAILKAIVPKFTMVAE
jgi:hypothetical protein